MTTTEAAAKVTKTTTTEAAAKMTKTMMMITVAAPV